MNQNLQTEIDKTLDLLAMCFDTCADLARMAKGADAKKSEDLGASAGGLVSQLDARCESLTAIAGEPNPLVVAARDFISTFSEGLGDISVEHWRHEQGFAVEDEG